MKNIDDERLSMLKEAFRTYAAKNGEYPKGANWQIALELANPRTGIRFVASRADSAGNLLDAHGHPYVFFFSKEGWVLIAALAEDGTAIERQALLPPIARSSPQPTEAK